MKFCTMFLVFGVIVAVSASNSGSQLDYHNQEEWGGVCQTGQNQSPVDLPKPTISVTVDGPLRVLSRGAREVAMRNLYNKNTIKFAPVADITLAVPGVQDAVAKVLQLHFHWGENSKGSEHLIEGVQYAAESHLVTSYGDNKYAVFARFFTIGRENEALDELMEAQEKREGEVEEFDLFELYPPTNLLYTYEGSLTTPGCDEVVHWVIDPRPLTVSRRQLYRLRRLHLGDGHTPPLRFNWRHAKPMNGRQVTEIKFA